MEAQPGRPTDTAAPPDPKARFDDRVEAYVRHRPGYPDEVVRYLEQLVLAAPGMTVADVGCGTGISSALFVRHGYDVVGVEPNEAMRRAAEGRPPESPAAPPRADEGDPVVPGPRRPGTFRTVAGSAEATTLPADSVDLAVAGQAFHWFDRAAAKAECRRILRPGGGAALFWNTRLLAGSRFAEAYEALLVEFGTDYAAVRHDGVGPAAIAEFFAPAAVASARFPNAQRFDYAGLEGRLLSSSYVPGPGHPRHRPMLAALRRVFDECQVDGAVVMAYETEVYAGRLR